MADIQMPSLKIKFVGDLANYTTAAKQFSATQKNLEAQVDSFGKKAAAFDAHAKAAQKAVAPVQNLTSAVKTANTATQQIATTQTGAASAMTRTQQAAQNLNKQLSGAGGLSGLVTNVTSGFKNFSSSISSGISKTVSFSKSLFEYIFYAKEAVGIVGNFVQSLFAQNAAMEQTRIAFVGMLNSGKAADDMLASLQDFAAKTPFEFPELATNARLLLAMGFNAKEIIPWLTAVGDTVSGLGAGTEVMQRIIYSMGQMKSMGRVTGEEMRELAIAGVPAWNWLAKAIGTDVPTAMKLAQKGSIDVNTALNALKKGMEGAFGGQMANQAQTFNGLISTMKDNMGMAWREISGGAFEKVKGALQWLVTMLDPAKIKPFAIYISNILGVAIKNISLWITVAYKQLKIFFDQMAKNNSVKTFLEIINKIKDIITTVLVGTIINLSNAFGGIGDASGKAGSGAKGVADAIADVAQKINTLLSWLATLVHLFEDTGIKGDVLRAVLIGIGVEIAAWKIANLITSLIPLAIGFWGAATAAWAFTAALLANPVTWIMVAIVALIAIIVLLIVHWNDVVKFITTVWNVTVSWIVGTLKTIGAWFTSVWTSIATSTTNTWNSIAGFFVSIWNTIVGFVMGIWNKLVSFIATGATNFYNAIIQPILPIVAWFGSVFTAIYLIISKLLSLAISFITLKLTEIYKFITDIWNIIYTFIAGIFTKIYIYIADKITQVADFLSKIWGNISGTVSDTWNTITSFIVKIWDTISGSISEKVSSIWKFLSDIWGRISSEVSTIWGNISKVIGDIWGNIWKTVTDTATKLWNAITDIFTKIKTTSDNLWKGVINGIIDMLNGGIGAVRNFLNAIADGLNSVMGFLGISGHNVGHVSLPDIPHLARGTENFSGGAAFVGEQGPELAIFPKGTKVKNAQQTRSLRERENTGTLSSFSGGGGGIDIGKFMGDLWSGIVSNVSSIGSKFLSGFNLALNMGGGVMGTIATGMIGKVGGWIGDWIKGLIPTSAANLPQATYGQFRLPPGGGFHEMYWYGLHQGMDMQFPQGSLLQEIIGGKISNTGFYDWGGEVDVQLSNGLTERYLHLSAIFAHMGDMVRRGDALGLTGGGTVASGLGYWSNGPHLHVQYDTGSYQAGIDPLRVWAQYGLFSPFSFAHGGVIHEPVMGIGMRSGGAYSFGEQGPETITPGIGGSNETNTLLRGILTALQSGQSYSRYELAQAMGSLIADALR